MAKLSMKNTSKIIRKADLTKNFTIIPNSIAQSKTLKPNAKSLIIHLLSMPDNWYYVKTQFWKLTNLGRDAFNRAWKELEEAGYIQSERIVEGNLVRGYNYIISDLPIFGITENQVYRDSVNQDSGTNKRNINKEKFNKKVETNNSKASQVPAEKSFIESFIEKHHRFPTNEELLNYTN